MGKNKIASIPDLSFLGNLRILSIQSNRLTSLGELASLSGSLEELYVSHNGLETLDGIQTLSRLRVLDITANRISKLEHLNDKTELEEFWASDNELADFGQIERQLGRLAKLETVYFEGNPLQRTAGANYQRKVRLALPQVRQIDATYTR